MVEKYDLKKVKEWAIREMECSLQNYTYPQINKATIENFKKALKQDLGEEERENLETDYKIFKVINKW